MVMTGENKKRYQKWWMQKRREEVIEQVGGKCVQCGRTDTLEIDHIDPDLKAISISSIISMSLVNPIRVSELAKCQLLCSDCHKRKTYANAKIHGIYGYRKGCRCDVCSKAKHDEKQRYLNRHRP